MAKTDLANGLFQFQHCQQQPVTLANAVSLVWECTFVRISLDYTLMSLKLILYFAYDIESGSALSLYCT